MNPAVKLLFGVHAHQPAGNFPAVIRDARDRCYGPFFEVLERHPEFRFAVHVSGWLLGFLASEYPDDVGRLRRMIDRGQAEIIGGGDTEPILAALSERDRRSQIGAMNARLRKVLHARPTGAWLAERAWEATVVPSLASSAIRYVAVDDYHFMCAGLTPESLHGYYATEEGGQRLDLFPISEQLRYKVPFAPVHEAIGYLESVPPGGAAVYFDDIEKFGIWPETHDWVYGRRWLEDFIEAVLRSTSIEPMRYADFRATHPCRGIVYLPTVSYAEMGEWTLPPRAAARYAQLVDRSKGETTYAQDKPFIRGGHWRNFFSRYPESNWMHKRVAGASSRLHSLPRASRTAGMRDDLHLAQANDAYWHGLFGGIYLPHLRRQVYAALARLEGALDAANPRPGVAREDIDLDGRDEVVLANRALIAVVRPHDRGVVCELTHYGLAHNFADTLARRAEHYHDRMRSSPVAPPAGAPASIHDRVAFRTDIVSDDLAVDDERRAMFADAWTPAGGSPAAVRYDSTTLRRASVALGGRADDASVLKNIRFTSDGLVVRYDVSSAGVSEGELSVLLDVAMPSCDGPGGSFVADGEPLGVFIRSLQLDDASVLELRDSELGGSIGIEVSDPARMETRAHYTASQSEAGFEKIMQAVNVRIAWAVRAAGPTRATRSIRLRVKKW